MFIITTVKHLKKFTKKIFSDLLLTLYDDFEFKFISLPRVVFAIASTSVIISWIGNQFFGYKFDGFTQLVAWATSCAGAYGVKKYTESKNSNSNTFKKSCLAS